METIALPDHCHHQVHVAAPPDVLAARRVGHLLCERTGLSPEQQENVSLIITELATNLLRHATSGGTLLLRRLDGRTGVECISCDRGPGIADLPAALRDGHSSISGRGVGLGAIRRLSDEFHIHSEPELGTAVLSRVRRDDAQAPAAAWRHGAVMLPMAGMSHCGDGWAVLGGTVAVIDGLGHGLDASVAARRAEMSMRPGDDPATAIQVMHEALQASRGAVAMVAQLDDDSVRFSGVGNIGGAVIAVDRLTRLHSSWGVVGDRISPPTVNRTGWQKGDVLLLHSDGVSRAIEAFAAAHLRYVEPALACAIVLRDASTKLDDQTVFMVRNG
jgi:anti-sigma regulatory factor (Ser/Thr protein kinase)